MYAAEPEGFDFDHLSLLPLVVKSAHILCKIKICLVTLADFSEEYQEAWTFGLVCERIGLQFFIEAHLLVIYLGSFA